MTYRFAAILLLLRPQNLLIAAASVVVAALLAGAHEEHVVHVAFAALSCALIAGGGYALNDLCDVDSDRINHPLRPLALGLLPRGQALVIWITSTLVGVVFASAAGDRFFFIAFIWAIALFVYSVQWKRTALLGNILVSFVTALAVYFGAAVTVNFEAAKTPALFAFLANLAREMIKDVEDAAGDKAAGARTLPIRFGERTALLAAIIPLAALIAATIQPFLAKQYGGVYLAIVLVADSILAYGIVVIVRRPTPRQLTTLSNLIKLSMAIGILALFSAGW
jgi:geranylgeranylglycerol-phosphate geranylgeranyltransferase